MKIDEIPHTEMIQIYERIIKQKQSEATQILIDLEKQWFSYNSEMQLSMFNHILCQMIHIIGMTTVTDSIHFTIYSNMLAEIARPMTAYFISKVVCEEYEKKLTPEVDELKRMMDL